MDNKIFDLKNKLTTSNNEEYLNLAQPTFTFLYTDGIKAVYQVTDETAMRPDLISFIFFGSEVHSAAICKVNGIFNPFSLEEGRVIIIPNISDKNYSKPKLAKSLIGDGNEVRAQYTDAARMSKKDANRIERLKNKGNKNAVQTPLPPNVLPPGTVTKEFKDGVIKLGANFKKTTGK